MPFDVGNAARFNRTVVLKFNQEKLSVTYNAGEKFKRYQDDIAKLEQERADLQYQIQRFGAGETEEDRAKTDAAYQKLVDRLNATRRAIADSLCTVIVDWDLEVDIEWLLDAVLDQSGPDAFRSLLAALKDSDLESTGTREVELPDEEKKQKVPVYGHQKLPVVGEILDGLPLPDDFILKIRDTINENFNSGGATGNA